MFPMQWPEEVENFFALQSAISSASQALLSPDCELLRMSPAEASTESNGSCAAPAHHYSELHRPGHWQGINVELWVVTCRVKKETNESRRARKEVASRTTKVGDHISFDEKERPERQEERARGQQTCRGGRRQAQ